MYSARSSILSNIIEDINEALKEMYNTVILNSGKCEICIFNNSFRTATEKDFSEVYVYVVSKISKMSFNFAIILSCINETLSASNITFPYMRGDEISKYHVLVKVKGYLENKLAELANETSPHATALNKVAPKVTKPGIDDGSETTSVLDQVQEFLSIKDIRDLSLGNTMSRTVAMD